MADLPPPADTPLLPEDLGLNIGAFLSMSGRIRNLIMLPRMNTCSTCVTRPSLAVTVIFCIWQFMLSSASSSFPRYTSPVVVSSVTMCPSASCSSLMGIPIDMTGAVQRKEIHQPANWQPFLARTQVRRHARGGWSNFLGARGVGQLACRARRSSLDIQELGATPPQADDFPI